MSIENARHMWPPLAHKSAPKSDDFIYQVGSGVLLETDADIRKVKLGFR